MNDVKQIELNAKEYKTLREVEKLGCVSDEVADTYPYDYLLRLGLLERGYSDRYPYTPLPGVVEIPLSVYSASFPSMLGCS